MERTKKQSILANLALVLTCIFWGSSFVFQKIVSEELSAYFIVAARFTVAGLILMAATVKKWHLIDKKYILGGLITGMTMAMGTVLQTIGMKFGTTAGKSAFLTPAYCVMMPFLVWIFMKEKPRVSHVFSAILCMVGIGVISLDGAFHMTVGDIFSLLGSLCFGLNVLSLSVFSKGRDPIVLTMLQIVCSAILGWIGTFATGGMPTGLTLTLAGNLLYLALFPTALSLSLQTYGFKYTNPTVGTIILSLESVFGIAFSVILYNEVVDAKMALGCTIVFIAVILSQLSFGKKETA